MRNPIYKFELGVKGDSETLHPAYPIYKEDAAKEIERQSQEQFYRTKLSSKLKFVSSDFYFILRKPLDTCYTLIVSISYDGGDSWLPYWKGQFWRTDCELDEDSEICQVSPEVDDEYVNILNGIEKEYDLIKLAPKMVPLKYDKRPAIQVYVAGASSIGYYLSGMYWEDEVADPTSDYYLLTNTYHFSYTTRAKIWWRKNVQFPLVPDSFQGKIPRLTTDAYTLTNGDFELRYVPGNTTYHIEIWYQGTKLWDGDSNDWSDYTLTLSPVSGTIAQGQVKLQTRELWIYTRYLCDVDQISGVDTYPIPTEDLTVDNRNYRRCIGYARDITVFTDRLTTTPTEYGIQQPGLYYDRPAIPSYYGEIYPCAKSTWGELSLWFCPGYMEASYEEVARKQVTLRDCYTLGSAISVLLGEIAPELSFDETPAYSQFLFGTNNPITGIAQTLLIAPKTNITKSGYDQPAQKAPVTLRTIFNMMRDCFRCYWFIENGKLRIEHISFFQHGSSYTEYPVVGRDLTQELNTRNEKPWSFAKGKYSYDKLETAGRYQFNWMDDVTQIFEGDPIDIVSSYVDQSQIEDVTVSDFTSDIDYALLMPNSIAEDGFMIFAAVADTTPGYYKLPYYDFIFNYTSHILQNPYMSFKFLQNYYRYDMPARYYKIGSETIRAMGVKKLKVQEITFPCVLDPEVLHLIKTSLGSGVIRKISINLCSRIGKASLEYDIDE